MPEQGAAAVFAAFDVHIHEAFFAVKCGVRIEDEAVVGGVHRVALGLQERVFGGWRFGFQYVDPGAAEVAAGDGVEHGEHNAYGRPWKFTNQEAETTTIEYDAI